MAVKTRRMLKNKKYFRNENKKYGYCGFMELQKILFVCFA